GKGDGTFYDPLEFASGAKAYDLAVADLNGGGALDVVTSSNARDFVGVAVLLTTGAGSTALTSSANNVKRGASVTCTATGRRSPVQGVTVLPTGNVNFLDGTTVLGSGALASSGKATFTTTALTSGSHNMTAQYVGDANYVASTSSVLVETILPGQ